MTRTSPPQSTLGVLIYRDQFGTPRGWILICHDFATVCLRVIRFMRSTVTSLAAMIRFCAVKSDYALYVAPGPRLDTVGVWGSNPHAPTISVKTNRGERSDDQSFTLRGDLRLLCTRLVQQNFQCASKGVRCVRRLMPSHSRKEASLGLQGDTLRRTERG